MGDVELIGPVTNVYAAGYAIVAVIEFLPLLFFILVFGSQFAHDLAGDVFHRSHADNAAVFIDNDSQLRTRSSEMVEQLSQRNQFGNEFDGPDQLLKRTIGIEEKIFGVNQTDDVIDSFVIDGYFREAVFSQNPTQLIG